MHLSLKTLLKQLQSITSETQQLINRIATGENENSQWKSENSKQGEVLMQQASLFRSEIDSLKLTLAEELNKHSCSLQELSMKIEATIQEALSLNKLFDQLRNDHNILFMNVNHQLELLRSQHSNNSNMMNLPPQENTSIPLLSHLQEENQLLKGEVLNLKLELNDLKNSLQNEFTSEFTGSVVRLEENFQAKIDNLSNLVDKLLHENLKLCEVFREAESQNCDFDRNQEYKLPRGKYSDAKRTRRPKLSKA